MNDDLWRCLTCHNCNERCPQDVNPYEVVVKLKNIAIREGKVSVEKREESIAAYNLVAETGFSYPASELTDKKREEQGLEKLKNTKPGIDNK